MNREVRVVVFGPERRVGALHGDMIVDLNAADPAIPATLEGLIAAGSDGLERAADAVERSGNGKATHPSGSVRLHAPCIQRPRIACAGGNYAMHLVGGMRAHMGKEVTAEEMYEQTRAGGPWGFWKVADVCGPGEAVTHPARAEQLDYEGEVAVVIGRQGKDIPVEQVGDYIWGVTLVNDWSIRNDMKGPHHALNFNTAKNFDNSTSLGPCVVAGGDIDPQNVDLGLSVNGELRQKFSSNEMIFSFAELIAFLSRDFTFEPGDIVAGGTGAGTVMDSTVPGSEESKSDDRFLQVGDVVDVSSPRIGMLRSPITAKA